MRRLRFWLGRKLIHAGLRAMPQGTVRDELTALLTAYGDHIRATVVLGDVNVIGGRERWRGGVKN